jgi:hypothetical protein
MGDPSSHKLPEVEVIAHIGPFTVERTHIPNGPNILLAFLCLRTNSPDEPNERIIIVRSGPRNNSWTPEFVARNATIWLRNWERQQVKYPPAPDDRSREEWRYDAVATALRDLMQRYPNLAPEDFSYLAPCSNTSPDAWAKLSPRERAKRSWWLWDEGGYYSWEDGELVERVFGERLAQVGAFDLHALRLRWPDGHEEPASQHGIPWYEFVLCGKEGPLRLLCTSWWGGSPGTVLQEPAKTVEDIEIWLGSTCLDIANGLEYAARFADEETRERILAGVARRQAQYDDVLPAWKEARTAYLGPQITYRDKPEA